MKNIFLFKGEFSPIYQQLKTLPRSKKFFFKDYSHDLVHDRGNNLNQLSNPN